MRSIVTVLDMWRLVLALGAVLSFVSAHAQSGQVYDIHLPAQSVAQALNGLSERTGVPVVFSYDLVKNRKAHPVDGRYTVQEALDALLKDTGLSGGLSDKGVLTVSLMRPRTLQPGESLVKQTENREPTNTSTPKAAGIAGFFASIAAAFTAHAQDADIAPNAGVGMQEVLVTAEKKTEKLQDVPVPVAIVDTQVLAENNQVLLRDYFSRVPGLSLSPDENGLQNLSIRGITQAGFANPTVGFLVDDVPFGSSTNSLPSLPEVDPGDLERIEVLRGPQGTLYGASSLGGLVKIVTKDPSLGKLSGDVQIGGSAVQNGAEAGYNVRASINVPLSDTLAIRASAFKRQDPGYVDNPVLHVDGINETEVYGGRLATLWQPSTDFSVNLKALYQHSAADGSSEVDKEPGLGDLQQNYFAGVGGLVYSIQDYSATIKGKLDGIDFTSVTGYLINKLNDSYDYGSAFFNTVAAQAFPGATGAPFGTNAEDDRFTQEIRLSGSIWQKLDWLAGGYFTRENKPADQFLLASNATTGQVLGTVSVFGESSGYREYAGFGDLTYHFTDQFDLQVGGREAHINPFTRLQITTGPFAAVSPATSTADNKFTYLVTPRFKVTSNVMVYARFASGFRPGSGDDNPPPTAFCVEQHLQCAVKPDTTKSYELGVKGDFLDRRVSIDVSTYYIDWQDIQLSLRSPTGFVYFGNGSAAKSEGAEFSVSVIPLTGLSVGAWIAYDDAVMTQAFAYGVAGDRLPSTSKWSGNFSIQQDIPLSSSVTGYVGGDVSYVGDRLGVFTGNAAGTGPGPQQYLPMYVKTDLRSGVRYESWTVNAYVNNVTNRRGLLNGGIGYSNPVAYQVLVPRTIGMSVSKSF